MSDVKDQSHWWSYCLRHGFVPQDDKGKCPFEGDR